jgi:hypothetical protein
MRERIRATAATKRAQQFPQDAGWQVRQRWVAAGKIRRVEGGSE